VYAFYSFNEKKTFDVFWYFITAKSDLQKESRKPSNEQNTPSLKKYIGTYVGIYVHTYIHTYVD
jgi:hypothetical protein